MVPLITIVVCTFNRADMLKKALENLMIQEPGGEFCYEVIVVDDGSTDHTMNVVEAVELKSNISVKYILAQGNGYTEAMNQGVKKSSGEWLAFFDDDQLVDSNWLKELFTYAVENNNQLVSGTRILELPEDKLSKLGPVCRALCGEANTSVTQSKKRFFRSKIDIGGGNLLIKRKIFNLIGYFDETIKTGGCDLDLVMRARDSGFSIGWAPKAIIRHIIPPYRISPDQIKWYSTQVGCSFAHIDWKRWGLLKTTCVCIARICRDLFINLPFLLIYYIKIDNTKVLDLKALIWKDIGYLQKTLSLLAPNFFQEQFFLKYEFRKGRKTLKKD